MIHLLSKLVHSEQGTATVLVAIAMTVMIGFVALASDAGLIYLNHMQISNTLDAAVLAGVQELPGDPAAALAVAAEYAEANGLSSDEYVFSIGVDNTSITGNAVRDVEMHLARVLGIERKDVDAVSQARLSPVSGTAGVVPFGVVDDDYAFGSKVTLKVGGGMGDTGCFGALRLGGSGADVYLDNIKYGYDGVVYIGDMLDVETGNMSGPTAQGIAYRIDQCQHTPQCSIYSYEKGCPRICVLPLGVYDDNVGSNKNFTVTGFAAFLIDEYVDDGNECLVNGWFIEYVTPGITGEGTTEHGLYTAELCR